MTRTQADSRRAMRHAQQAARLGENELEKTVADFIGANGGRPVCDLVTAAMLAGVSATTLRRAVWSGEITVSRRAKNAPMTIRIRELVRWLLDGERHSLPAGPIIDGE